jgi:uncharacterized repeat protein (TIGR01451 family)
MSQLTKASLPGSGSAPNALGIGNFVFLDYNRNGIQDTGEPGIANVRVRLFQSGIERAQVLTDANGLYSFTNANVPTGLLPNTAYEVRILPADFPANLKLTKYQQGGNSELDSDAQLLGGNAVIFLTTNNTDTPTNSYDFGFVAGNPDLLITKSASPSQVIINGNATFTIQVTNTGSGAATNVVVRDTLDAGLTYVSSSPVATTVAYGSGRILTWNLGTLTSGAASTLTVGVTAVTEGVLYNTAYVTTTDTENSLANNGSRTCVTVPIKLCTGEEYVANLPAQYTNVQWFKDGGTTPVGSGNSFTIVASGSYTFTATASANCPAASCCPIIVENGTVPTLAITPVSPVICAGQSTSLTVAGCTGGSLLWSANAASATTASIIVSPTVTTVYSVTCTPTGYGTCPGTTSTTVTVNPSVTATLSSATICNGTSATLVATGGATYAFSDGTTNSTGILVVAPTVNGANPYSVTVTSGQGCSAVASGIVTVNLAVTATLSSATICNGTSATLTASGGSSYAFSDGTTNTTGILVVAPTINGANPYSVTVTSAQGCSATASGIVTVNPSVTATLSSATICNGTSATLTASGGSSYAFSDGTTNTTGLLVVSPTINGANPYSVTVMSGQGCSAVATATVTVNPSVTATIAVSSATVCQGESITLTANGGVGYLWSTAETTATISVTASGTYSVTVTSTEGCSGTASTTVTVNPAPQLTVNSATVCAGSTATLTVDGCAGGTLRWATGDNTASLIVTPLVTTTYSATCTFSTGCTATVSTTVTVNPAPTYDVVPTAVPASCVGNVANNDARIDLTTLQNTVQAGISAGGTYTGPAYGDASNQSVSGGAVSFTNLPNPASPQPYTIRLYSANGACFTDVTVVLSPADCQCPAARCVPVVIRKTR